MIKSPVIDVYEFQTKILKNEFPDKPLLLQGTHKVQQIEKLEEEIQELKDAVLISDQADALVDLIYLSLGSLHQMGVPFNEVWDAVHTANMTKVRGTTQRGHDNDAAKPNGWSAPDHTWLDK